MTDHTMETHQEHDCRENDPALRRVLREWQDPEIPETLDSRILADYRVTTRKESLWRRFFAASVRVPLPVAVAAMMLLLLAGIVALQRPTEPKMGPTAQSGSDRIDAVYKEDPVVTHTSLEGFQPVSDVNVTVSEESRK